MFAHHQKLGHPDPLYWSVRYNHRKKITCA